MKNWLAQIAGSGSLLFCGAAPAQYGTMMDSGAWGNHWMGGFDAMWIAILLALAVGGGVAWVFFQKRK